MPERISIDSLEREIDRLLDERETDGYSGITLVGYDDHVVYERGVGLANVERSIQFGPDTVVSIGSITKQFTAAAIMKAESLGVLRVANRVGEYLDNVPDDKHEITLHHLLTHSSGLESNFAGDFDVRATRDWYVNATLASELRAPIGSHYYYSNAGFSLAAAILEIATGASYEAFLQQHLFEPAGMRKTGYKAPGWDPGQIAHGYVDGEDQGTIIEKPWDRDGPYWSLRGNGGIHSTASDMFAWHLALEDDAVLPHSYRTRLQAPSIREEGRGGEYKGSHYAYGWVVETTPQGAELTSHNGSDGVQWADYLRFREERVVVFLASNIKDKFCGDLRGPIENLLFR